RPERTVYRITEAGVEQFEVRLRALLATPIPEQPTFAAAVSILGYLLPREVLAAFRDREVTLVGMIAELEAQARALREDLALPRLRGGGASRPSWPWWSLRRCWPRCCPASPASRRFRTPSFRNSASGAAARCSFGSWCDGGAWGGRACWCSASGWRSQRSSS